VCEVASTGYQSNATGEHRVSCIVTPEWTGLTTCFICEGGAPYPKTMSSRCIVGFWWIFTILMTATYTSNLVAFFTVITLPEPINTLQELVGQTEVKPIYISGATLDSLFNKVSTPPWTPCLIRYLHHPGLPV
jgi:hypothetical protein